MKNKSLWCTLGLRSDLLYTSGYKTLLELSVQFADSYTNFYTVVTISNNFLYKSNIPPEIYFYTRRKRGN